MQNRFHKIYVKKDDRSQIKVCNMLQFTPHALERMAQRGISQAAINAAMANVLEKIATKDNRLALYSLVNDRYLLVILEKINNEETIITTMWSDKKRLRRIGFTKV